MGHQPTKTSTLKKEPKKFEGSDLPVPRKYVIDLRNNSWIRVEVREGGTSMETNLNVGVRANSRMAAAIDGFESLVLAAASAGVDIDSPAFIYAMNSSLEAIYNQLG